MRIGGAVRLLRRTVNCQRSPAWNDDCAGVRRILGDALLGFPILRERQVPGTLAAGVNTLLDVELERTPRSPRKLPHPAMTPLRRKSRAFPASA
jgi:hypothetical protein